MPRRRGNGRAGARGRGGRVTTRKETHAFTGRSGDFPRHERKNRNTGLGFTLTDEARHTSQHDESFWSQTNKLRGRPVLFVSAGMIEPMKQLDALLQTQEAAGSIEADKEARAKPASITQQAHLAASEGVLDDNKTSTESGIYFPDTEGSNVRAESGLGCVDTQDTAGAESSSDGEVILFKGRDHSKHSDPSSRDFGMTQMHRELQIVEEQLTITRPKPSSRSQMKTARAPRKSRQRSERHHELDAEDLIIADYIANLHESGEYDDFAVMQNKQRDLGGSDYDLSSRKELVSSKANLPAGERETTDKDSSDEISGSETGQLSEDDADLLFDDRYASESELDDETLARLIAGQQAGFLENRKGAGLIDHSASPIETTEAEERFDSGFDSDDLMDWARPSLQRRRGKGNIDHGLFALEPADAELRAAMNSAWSTDRMKKSQRKKQREQLRAAGLLGKSTKSAAVNAKYESGMNLNQVAEEIREFLVDRGDMLILPPMDKHARKVIHELANKFNIKSKSTGKGHQRRPTLYRTARTMPYAEAIFERTIMKINRPFFPRLDGKDRRTDMRGSSHAQTSYRDGEVVGAAAPELGAENRGRNMLEKMGWSKGTALGAVDNKGILLPVSQTMKRNKAGLG